MNSIGLTDVAPFTGAWIEIVVKFHDILLLYVAPFTGAWIEIASASASDASKAASHPSRVRGLKCATPHGHR